MLSHSSLSVKYDAVVILGQSSWSDFSKSKNDGCQYILKIASQKPVFFIQRYDVTTNGDFFIDIDDKLSIVSPQFEYSIHTLEKVLRKIRRKGGTKVLFWVYSTDYIDVLSQITVEYSAVYYALEDNLAGIFSPENINVNESLIISKIRKTINFCSSVLADTILIADQIKNDSDIIVPIHLIKKKRESSSSTSIEDNFFYEKNFSSIIEIINNLKIVSPITKKIKKNIIVIYDRNSCHVSNLRENLDAFGIFSKNLVTYVHGTGDATINQEYLDSFDVVVVHYSVRLSVPGHLSESFKKALITYVGLKVLFLQDEYDHVKSTHDYITEIDFDVLYTIINENYCYKLYPKDRFPYLKIIYILTGYIPYKLIGYSTKPLVERQLDVFYRGRELPYHYGSLGREKFEISKKFSEALQVNNLSLKLDIDSDNSKRIYGDGWYKALSSAKTMLGTESGSNVFDFNGDLQILIQADINEGLSYAQIFEKRLLSSEEEWHVNMISPKAFEAIMLGTVLVLYEGDYSGILVPNRHYISLKKDFSNIQDVYNLIQDNDKLLEIQRAAFEEIACNPKYSYEYFITNYFDTIIDQNVLCLKSTLIVPERNYFYVSVYSKNANNRIKRKFGYLPPTKFSSEAEYIHDTIFEYKSKATIDRVKKLIHNIYNLRLKIILFIKNRLIRSS